MLIILVDCLHPYLVKVFEYTNIFHFVFVYFSLIHLIVTVLFQGFVMRDVEKLAGCIRIAVIYFGSGIAGNLASAIFLPYQVEVRFLFISPILLSLKNFDNIPFILAICINLCNNKNSCGNEWKRKYF